MASALVKPALLRHATLAAATCRRTPAAITTIAARSSQLSQKQQNNLLHQVPSSQPVAAFHASSRRALLPPGPQVIKGDVNDPAPMPPPSASHGSYHWTFERLLAAGLVPLTLAPFAAGSLNPTLDAVLCGSLLLHSHLGLKAIIIDYVPTGRYPKARKASMWGVNVATALVGVGLYEFETNDVGLTEAVRRIWTA